jgi:hypothetical protein
MLPTRTQGSGQRQDSRYAAPEVPIGNYISPAGPGGAPYVVPDSAVDRENGYQDSAIGAWAPKLRQEPGATPDPMRTQQMPQRDYRPTPLTGAPDLWWRGPGPGREIQQRHNSAEFVDADGWEPTRPVGALPKRAAPDPRRTPPEEPRPTNRMAPNRWIYTRPFDQHAAHRLNGIHFSMADHRRQYPIMGMQPITTRRNTYRLDPGPWDTDIVDEQPSADYTPNQRIQQVELPTSTSRSWRL